MKTTSTKQAFANALHRAEGTISAHTGGRASWDCVALKETALAAMAGEKPSTANMGPGEYKATREAFAKIAARTTEAHKNYAAAR